jgi:hypothetical protein
MNNIFMTSDKIKINELLIQHPAQQPIYSSTYKKGSLICMVHQVSLFSRDRLPTGETRDTGATVGILHVNPAVRSSLMQL